MIRSLRRVPKYFKRPRPHEMAEAEEKEIQAHNVDNYWAEQLASFEDYHINSKPSSSNGTRTPR